ncbi:MAG: hypothetical protein CK424_03030 [Legionella sp.]|nr:MAG: hypothetical protein CK424_03030 [Legionella sp.]
MTIGISWLKTRLGAIEPKVIRFLLVGGFNTLLGLSLFPTIYWIFAAYRSHYVLMLAGCHITNVMNSYITNKYFVFRTKGYNTSEMSKFVFYHISYFLVMITIIPILVQSTHVNPVVIQFSLSVLVIIGSFFWYDKIVFLPKKDNSLA